MRKSSLKTILANRRRFLKEASILATSPWLARATESLSLMAEDSVQATGNWFKNLYRLLHVDAHFGHFTTEIYKDFDAESVAQRYEDTGAQLVSYMAEDGYCYYPTQVGVKHPTLRRDFTGELTMALKRRGLKTIVYVSAAEERRIHREHPEWIYNSDASRAMADANRLGISANMCKNTPWVEASFIPRCREILELYDVDGFFVDGVLQPYLEQGGCHCRTCRDLFDREVGGPIPIHDHHPKAFAYRKWSNQKMEAYMHRVYRVLAGVKPEIAVLNNYAWMSRYPVTPPSYVKHVCWDTPAPNYGMYSWNFSFEARYLAALVDILPDLTWSCMNVTSHSWSDYELRETEAFLHESAILLAGCGRTYVAYNPYPSGNPAPAVMEALTRVNQRTRELEPFLKGCRPVKDVAILHSADSIFSKAPIKPTPAWVAGPAYHPVNGAHKVLIEGHVQLGILNSQVLLQTLQEYRALILADQRILTTEECEVIRRFVSQGGGLIATFETGTRDGNNQLLNRFSLADVLGVDYLGSSDTANSYLRFSPKNDQYQIPAYDIPVVGPYARVKTTDAATLIELVPPFEGIKTGTPPPALLPEGPGVTLNSYGKGKAIYCAGELFGAYHSQDTPVLRKLALWLLEFVHSTKSRTVVLNNAPLNVELFYNQRGKERFVHLVNYSGDKREKGTPRVQGFTRVHGIGVKVRLDDRPAHVTTVPEGESVSSKFQDGWLSFEAEPLAIHSVYRIHT